MCATSCAFDRDKQRYFCHTDFLGASSSEEESEPEEESESDPELDELHAREHLSKRSIL